MTKWERTRAIRKELAALDGRDLEDALDRLASEQPDMVHMASVDDTHFATSTLAFVRCYDEGDDAMIRGCFVYYVGQCDGGEARFFVYATHADQIAAALQEAFS